MQVLLVLGSWLGALSLITLAFEPVPTTAVFGPATRTIAALRGTDARLMSAGTGYVIVRSESAGFVRELYRNGALLVLPVKKGGCLARS